VKAVPGSEKSYTPEKRGVAACILGGVILQGEGPASLQPCGALSGSELSTSRSAFPRSVLELSVPVLSGCHGDGDSRAQRSKPDGSASNTNGVLVQ
jgi:hypothetical protein